VDAIKPPVARIPSGKSVSEPFEIITTKVLRPVRGKAYASVDIFQMTLETYLVMDTPMAPRTIGSVDMVHQTLLEGQSTSATITHPAATSSTVFDLETDDPLALTMPPSVGFPSGSTTSYPFTITAIHHGNPTIFAYDASGGLAAAKSMEIQAAA
jgi:hypothetical protein